MRFITKLSALAASGALLLSGAAATPAQAVDGTEITVQYAGVARSATVTHATTVSEAIVELDLAVDGDDRVSPARDTAVTSGMTLVVDVVSTRTKTKKVTLKKATIYKKTSKLYKGDRKVVRKGRNGKAVRTFLTTTVNGVTTTELTREKITKRKIDRVVKVGVNGKRKINLARAKMWNRIAKCESGRRWHINTGNGYYGGLQFNLATWRSVKGYHFAKYPHKATRAEQITVANRLYAKRGLQPWGCRHAA